MPSKLKQYTLPEIDEIVVVMAGDMVEGEDIYPSQAHKLGCSVIEQAQAATSAYWEMLLRLEQEFPNTKVRVETCPGNHGRMSKSADPRSNWDNVVYQQLGLLSETREKYSGVKGNIGVNVSLGEFSRFLVKDTAILATHKGVKHTGTPAMLSKLAGWNQSMQYDTLVHGHWHKWEIGSQFGKAIVKNGCLCGPDDLSLSMGVYDPPRQAFFLVTGKTTWGFSCLEW